MEMGGLVWGQQSFFLLLLCSHFKLTRRPSRALCSVPPLQEPLTPLKAAPLWGTAQAINALGAGEVALEHCVQALAAGTWKRLAVTACGLAQLPSASIHALLQPAPPQARQALSTSVSAAAVLAMLFPAPLLLLAIDQSLCRLGV